jgi:hypothetical protein
VSRAVGSCLQVRSAQHSGPTLYAGPVRSGQLTGPVRGGGTSRSLPARHPATLSTRHSARGRDTPKLPQNRVACQTRNHSHSLETRVLVSGNLWTRRGNECQCSHLRCSSTICELDGKNPQKVISSSALQSLMSPFSSNNNTD